MSIYDIYKRYGAGYENAISVMWNVYRKKEFIPVILKDHSKRIWSPEAISVYAAGIKSCERLPEKGKALLQLADSIQTPNRDEIGEFVEFEYGNLKCRFYGAVEAGKIINGSIEEIFYTEVYEFLKVEKSTIIDIGANIGDTAVYFCLNHAEHIIALEPFPFSYRYANINVTANEMINKIKLLNVGYGKDLEVKVKDKKSNAGDILEIYDNGEKINTYSLRTLINMYGLNNKDNLLLKMDCEGCEYNLLDEPVNTLRKFKRIEIEFHYGYKNLESKLEDAGFSVRHSKPVKSSGNAPSLRKIALINKDLTGGYIYAERHPV
jgi:FkbM family methyltransferase